MPSENAAFRYVAGESSAAGESSDVPSTACESEEESRTQSRFPVLFCDFSPRHPHHGVAVHKGDDCASDSESEDPVSPKRMTSGSLEHLLGCCSPLRRFIYKFLVNHESLTPWCRRSALFYQVSTALIIVFLFVVDSTTAATVTTDYYWDMECAATLLWTLEYVLRFWSVVEEADQKQLRSFRRRCWLRMSWLTHGMTMIDTMALISLYIDLNITSNQLRGIASLRMLRLLTIYRLERDFNIFAPVLRVIARKGDLLLATLAIALTVLLVASVSMFYIEAPYNDDFSSVLSCMWWATTALTTVGYGDVYPTTWPGRLLASCVAFMGIGMFALPAGIIASGFQEELESKASLDADGRASSADVAELEAKLLARLDDHKLELASRVDGLQNDIHGLRGDVKALLSILKKTPL